MVWPIRLTTEPNWEQRLSYFTTFEREKRKWEFHIFQLILPTISWTKHDRNKPILPTGGMNTEINDLDPDLQPSKRKKIVSF